MRSVCFLNLSVFDSGFVVVIFFRFGNVCLQSQVISRKKRELVSQLAPPRGCRVKRRSRFFLNPIFRSRSRSLPILNRPRRSLLTGILIMLVCRKSSRFLKKMTSDSTIDTWTPTPMTSRSSRLRWRPCTQGAKSAKLLRSLRRHDVRTARTCLRVPHVRRDLFALRFRQRSFLRSKLRMLRRQSRARRPSRHRWPRRPCCPVGLNSP